MGNRGNDDWATAFGGPYMIFRILENTHRGDGKWLVGRDDSARRFPKRANQGGGPCIFHRHPKNSCRSDPYGFHRPRNTTGTHKKGAPAGAPSGD